MIFLLLNKTNIFFKNIYQNSILFIKLIRISKIKIQKKAQIFLFLKFNYF